MEYCSAGDLGMRARLSGKVHTAIAERLEVCGIFATPFTTLTNVSAAPANACRIHTVTISSTADSTVDSTLDSTLATVGRSRAALEFHRNRWTRQIGFAAHFE